MDTLYKGSVYRTEGRTQQDTAFFNPPQNKKHVTVDTAFDARATPFQIIQTKTIFHDHVKKTLKLFFSKYRNCCPCARFHIVLQN